jgi:hypothetical protein
MKPNSPIQREITIKSWINSKILITPPLFSHLYQGVGGVLASLCMIKIGCKGADVAREKSLGLRA